MKHLFAILIVSLPFFSFAQWEIIGPGSSSSSTMRVYSSASTVFARLNGKSEFYRSTDNGTNWTLVNGFYPDAVFYRDANGLYMADGDGLFRSTDEGQNWSSFGNAVPTTDDIISIFRNGSMLLVGTQGDGMYRSTNDGASWAAVGSSISVYDFGMTANNDIIAGTNAGAKISTDNGANWSTMGLSIQTSSVSNVETNSSYDYVVADNSIHRSNNSGQSWPTAMNGIPNGTIVRVLKVYDNVLFAGTFSDALYSSNDNGDSWTTLSLTGVFNTFTRTTSSGTTYFTDGAGLHSSSDGGTNWSDLRGSFSTSEVKAVSDLIQLGSDLVALSSAGIYTSTNGGDIWNSSDYPYGDAKEIVEAGSKLIIYSSFSSYSSSDNGNTWTDNTDTGFPSDPKNIFYENGNLYLGANDGLYVSSDDGSSWTKSTSFPLGEQPESITAINGNLYAGVIDGDPQTYLEIYESTDDGANWTAYQCPWLSGIDILTTDGTNLYIGGDGKVWKTNPAKQGWFEAISGSITLEDGQPVSAMLATPTSILVGMDNGNGNYTNGIYIVPANLGTPTNITQDLPLDFTSEEVEVTGFAFNNNNILASFDVGSNKGGILRGQHTWPAAIPSNTSQTPLLVSPNPVNNLFSVQLPNTNWGLRIFDAKGVLMVQQFDMNKSNIQIDASSWTSGVYLVQATNGAESRVTKIVVGR